MVRRIVRGRVPRCLRLLLLKAIFVAKWLTEGWAVPATISASRSEGRCLMRLLYLLVLATIIAALGLIVNSAAVVIGAMLVAPLMSPIVGVGLAMVLMIYRNRRSISLDELSEMKG